MQRFLLIFISLLAATRGIAAQIEREFAEMIHPFLKTYCFECHGEKQKGKLDLRPYSNREAIAKDYRRWETVLDKLKALEMPPDDADRQPSTELRRQVIAWIQANRKVEAQRNAGDPGPVLARRLSNAEYDYTIRDLTGVDLHPAREFPVDPANEAGFDNSGESLTMSPALLKKYLEAARRVADHIVLTPDGFVFAPHPVVTESDRDKYSVHRIIDFYRQHSTNYTDYFLAAWRFSHRRAIDKPEARLADFAANGISAKYLTTIWSTLTGAPEKNGPIATLQQMWRELPQQPELARAGCEQMSDFVADVRQKHQAEVPNLVVRGIAAGSQPLVLWKDEQSAANRTQYRGDGADDPALRQFCAIFPDAFYVAERGRVFLKEDSNEGKGRFLSAGFHLMTGYFRDDAPLYNLILDANQQRELDRLWDELHFITLDPIRQYKDFIFFERAEPPRFMQGEQFDFARSEDKDSTSEAKIGQLAEAYLEKARRNGGAGAAITAIQDYFKNISANIRRVEQARVVAEGKHIQALQTFIERAYRHPLSLTDQQEVLAFYKSLRANDGLDHEEAIRDTIVSVLMSPRFCYHVDPANSGSITTKWKAQPLSEYALASRLSYYLWSSMPDVELLAHAKAGDLHQPKVLLAQTRRMLQDDRIRRLATEFAGNWLDFRRFEEHNAVDRERFKSFNNELRQAMFEEPIHFFVDVVRRDRSVLDFLYANDTFVNPALVNHYGMADVNCTLNGWTHVEDARPYGRGGLLAMSVFLTKNAPGLRTSPVKRGYWVVRRLLGEQIPPPPPKVPELPSDETQLGDLTLRQALARHREDKACAGCHARFDGIGVAFEGYGPIGEQRARDLAGRMVDTRATFPGGSEGAGVEGLRNYLKDHRQDEFLDNFCRKMLSYALGRTLLLSDDVTIDNMRASLAANGYRFSSLIETIVRSPQFLMRRVPDDFAMEGRATASPTIAIPITR
ncbi:MAG TPA: DUF1592 domain-containing protein [Verrucomicrobiae bacterium]|nr:DUF1592 domain-containing protein [Verrucomicrobiae bacterium]